jgi:sugar lactone lactonase YvrE
VVLGQTSFTSFVALTMGASSLANPSGIGVDNRNSPFRLYVADAAHNRILIWNNAGSISNGQAADGVIGQLNFSGSSANRGAAVAANTLSSPGGIAVDIATGDLWVADTGNNRVLRFAAPIPVSGAAATNVIGQGGSFSGSTANFGGISSQSLQAPSDLSIDGNQNMLVADTGNNRVLRFGISNPSAAANQVWGQTDFVSNLPNQGGSTAVGTLSGPQGVLLSVSDVWVSDTGNNRVLRFPLFPPGSTSSEVLGQATFSGNQGNEGFSLCNGGTLKTPLGMSMDESSRLFVSDSGNNRVVAYNPPYFNSANLVYGQNGVAQNAAGCTNNQMNAPVAASALVASNLLVSDSANNRMIIYGCSDGVGPATFTSTVTKTSTPTSSPTATPTITLTATISTTNSPSPTFSVSPTFSLSPTQSITFTISPTFTNSPTASPSLTTSPTPSRTPISTVTVTPYETRTPTARPHPAGRALSYPNPVNRDFGQVSVAFPPGNQAQMQFYDLLLEDVRDLDNSSIHASSGLATWDLRNNSGERVVPGIYYIHVTVDGVSYMTKMTIY